MRKISVEAKVGLVDVSKMVHFKSSSRRMI